MNKIIQRRAYLELAALERAIINLGIGMPAGIGQIAHEAGKTDFSVTVESGVIGGIPAEELSFGAATNPEAIISQAAQFDFYDGGGLDIAFLGMAQLDLKGNVNVSRFGQRLIGVGGFVNIAQTAKRVVFLGTFAAGGTEMEVNAGKLSVRHEGRIRKIVPHVEQVSFNGLKAIEAGQKILYVTERAVFGMRDGELTVLEVAPGVDPQEHVLHQLPEGARLAPDLQLMDRKIFVDEPMH